MTESVGNAETFSAAAMGGGGGGQGDLQTFGDRPDRVGVPYFFRGGGWLLQGKASLKGGLQCGAGPPPRRRRRGGGFLKEGGGFFLRGGGLLQGSSVRGRPLPKKKKKGGGLLLEGGGPS